MKTGRRDWTGNSQAAFVTFGAEGHATHERAAAWYVWEKGFNDDPVIRWIN